jgi:hypothetical protein
VSRRVLRAGAKAVVAAGRVMRLDAGVMGKMQLAGGRSD